MKAFIYVVFNIVFNVIKKFKIHLITIKTIKNGKKWIFNVFI